MKGIELVIESKLQIDLTFFFSNKGYKIFYPRLQRKRQAQYPFILAEVIVVRSLEIVFYPSLHFS